MNLTKNISQFLSKFTSNKIFKRCMSLLTDNLDIILFIIIITKKALSYDKQITQYYSYKTSIIPVIASITIIASITLLFKNRTRTRILYFLDIIISIIIIADSAYYRYSKDVISLGTVRNGTMLGGVQASVFNLITPNDFIYFADIVILIPLLVLYKRIKRTDLKFFKHRLPYFIVLFAASLCINVKSVYALHIEQPRLLETMFNKIYIIQKVGCLNFHALDAYNVTKNSIFKLQKISPEKQNQIKTYLEKKSSSASKGTNLQGAGQGKNLIFIQVEALQQFVINQKINGQEITPNLNRWINKSLYFDNYFYQVAAGNTSDAEFLSNNSLYPAESGAAYYMYCGDTYDSLAYELNNKGYYSAVLHGYTEGFWNRNIMYKAEKFDNFFSERSYKVDEVVGMGLSDKSFLKQNIQRIKTFKQPYYAFTITLSSHYPFNDTKGYGNFDTGKYEGTLLGNYLKGIHYTDQQLGTYLDTLESDGILNNSIVVLYGDHFAIPKSQSDQVYDFQGIKNATDLDWYEDQKVPMFIHFPNDANKGVNHIYSGQIDLYPTISNLFNINPKYTFGKDLLNSSSNVVSFRNGSFTDGNVFYVSYADTYYDIKTKKVIPDTPKFEAMKNNTITDLEYSDDILNHNLLKTFIAEDSKK